ncbi:MAG TPA: PAS domain S-box protein [Methanoregulaceae archaeon]|nr:PAS domain S-box protein [Methanoregulaceae archaeon]
MGLEEDRAIARKIRTLLKAHPKGLIITEISQRLGINRNSAAKYLEILLFTGQVEVRQIGMAKIYTVSQRVPLSGLLRFAREQIVVVDDEGRIIQVNDRLLDFWQLPREGLLGERFDRVDLAPLRGLVLPPADGNGEAERRDLSFEYSGRTVHCRVSLIPTVFEDGGNGCTVIIEDVTAERAYERQIAENEARYRAVVEDQTELIARHRPDLTVTFANEACLRFFGADPVGIGTMDAATTMPPDDIRGIIDARKDQTPGSPVAHYLHQVRNRNGELRWLEWSDRALFGPDGTVSEYQLVGRDVTEDHERRRELLVKESAIAASVDGIAIIDPDGNIEYVNRAFATMFGYLDPGELAGRPYVELAQGDLVLGGIIAELEAKLIRDGHWFGEVRCLRRDGRAFPAQLSASVASDHDGQLLCILLSVVDVTERRQTEEALKLSRGKLQEAIEFMPDATFIVDRERQVVAWNRAMETLTGIPREEVMGTRDYGRAFVKFDGTFPVLVDLLDLSTEELARTYQGVRRFGETLYFETPVPSLRGGRGGHLWGKASPLSDRDGSEIGAIQTLRDISDWKRAEEAYRSALQRENRLRRLDGDGEGLST